jgi:predicted TIM-barrel fold metal-dependent hydrolase
VEQEPKQSQEADPTSAESKTPETIPEFTVHSAETYVHEPADLWQTNLDEKYKDQAFQLIKKAEDRWVWSSFDDKPLAAKGEASRKKEEATTAANLLGRLDSEGITGAVLYPSIAHRAYATCANSDQLDAFLAVYNDWILNLAAESPDRLKAVCLINVDHPKAGVMQMKALAVIPMAPGHERRYDMPQYEVLWEMAHELKRPMVLLASSNRLFGEDADTGRKDAFQSVPAKMALRATAWFASRRSITAIIFSGAFERYPDFHLGIVGHGAGWAPFAMVRGDEMQQVRPERTGPPTRVPDWVADEETIKQTMHLRQIADVAIDATKRSGTIGMAPEGVGFYFKDGDSFGDHFRRNVFLTFTLKGRLGLKVRKYLGDNTLLWGHRYPSQGTDDKGQPIPVVQERLTKALGKMQSRDRDRLVNTTTAERFGFAN